MADILGAGRGAPEFSLSVTPDQKLTLGELRGRAVVLAFFPADWSPVCGDQMTLYNELNQEDFQDDVLSGLADRLKLPRADLQHTLAVSAYSGRIKVDMNGGVRSGVNGTPAFFINGLRHGDAFDFETLSATIQSQLPTRRADQGTHHEHPLRR